MKINVWRRVAGLQCWRGGVGRVRIINKKIAQGHAIGSSIIIASSVFDFQRVSAAGIPKICDIDGLGGPNIISQTGMDRICYQSAIYVNPYFNSCSIVALNTISKVNIIYGKRRGKSIGKGGVVGAAVRLGFGVSIIVLIYNKCLSYAGKIKEHGQTYQHKTQPQNKFPGRVHSLVGGQIYIRHHVIIIVPLFLL